MAKVLKRLERALGVKRIAVMLDVHLAKQVCIGTILATDQWIYPAAVGDDAGCGGLTRILVTSVAGRAYLSDHQWALDYARANRARILKGALRVLGEILGAEYVEESTSEC